MKQNMLKIDRVFRKGSASKGLNIGKYTRIIRKNTITEKVTLTEDEKLKAKILLATNNNDHGFISLKEPKEGLFSNKEAIENNKNNFPHFIRRGVAISYSDGIAADFSVEPYFSHDEQYFLTSNEAKPKIYGTVDFSSNSIEVKIFKQYAQEGEIINLGSTGLLSRSNQKEILAFADQESLKQFLAHPNLSNIDEEQLEL
ncbi:MAG: hypothetical protein J6A28_02605 [Clostridia bacterium]|nr:hypothetical protein [Clostridia bacterium]